MTLAYIFATICGIFVTAVLALVFWTIISTLKDEAKHRKQGAILEKNKPAPTDEPDKAD
ncbi:MAG: hypothetical protein WB588_12025 [Dehalococcoidia bacterium]|jgi:hypothetical protein